MRLTVPLWRVDGACVGLTGCCAAAATIVSSSLVRLRGDSHAIVGIRVVAVACKVTIREDVEVCVGLAVGLKDGTHRLGHPAWHGRLLNNLPSRA